MIIPGALNATQVFVCLLFIVFKLTAAEQQQQPIFINNYDTIKSISSVLGNQLIFNTETFNELINSKNSITLVWYKGIKDLKPLISNSIRLAYSNSALIDSIVVIHSHYHLVNHTKLNIEQTVIGDEGFYTLKVQTNSSTYQHYLYHVTLFTPNLALVIFPSSPQRNTYHAGQQINFTCSIILFADHTYIEQSRSLFLSIWYMIIYNNDPDQYQLFPNTSNSYTYLTYLTNYELNEGDHNQIVSCALVQQELSQQKVILNITGTDLLNIEYKAYLRGNYYFIRSFSAHSSIEINCEEFNANPKAVYTLIWILNEKNQTLLNKTEHGRYLIENATWRQRGNYICLAENYLNNNQPVHQSFRLNIWFDEHQAKLHSPTKTLVSQQSFQLNSNRSIILLALIITFLFACLLFILSFYYFCLQSK